MQIGWGPGVSFSCQHPALGGLRRRNGARASPPAQRAVQLDGQIEREGVALAATLILTRGDAAGPGPFGLSPAGRRYFGRHRPQSATFLGVTPEQDAENGSGARNVCGATFASKDRAMRSRATTHAFSDD